MFHLDYETRSRADLKKVGAFRYASDPSTRILMFAIREDQGETYLWFNPAIFPLGSASQVQAIHMLDRAFLNPSAILWAHNAEFERAVTRYRAMPDLGVAAPQIEQWRCTAALARKAGLRASLANVGEDLKLAQTKFGEGFQLIKLFSIPQKDTNEFVDPKSQPDKFRRFGEYCVQDVISESAVHKALMPFELRGATLDAFLFDARMNDRGLPVNVKALRHAQAIIEEVQARVVKEFRQITGLEPSQRDKVKALLEGVYGVKLRNMQSKTLDDTIAAYHNDEDEDEEWEAESEPDDVVAKKILELYKLVSFSATKKIKTMLDCVCDDGFIRGMFLWHGAGTGRWSGQKVQPQNFRRPTIKDADGAYALICAGASADEIEMVYGNPLEAIANCIRNFIHDPEGPMFDADYAAVEARIVNWLAEQEDAIERFRKGVDSYLHMASVIYDKPASLLKNPSPERELGKRVVLGCGFGMWWPKFQKTCWGQYRIKVSDELAERAVIAYRDTHDKVVQLWKDCEMAVRRAILNPGQVQTVKKLSFVTKHVAGIRYLLMTLPSGRNVAYPHPEIDGEGSITYYGQLPGTKKWGRVSLYGGKIVENATQAVAADAMSVGAVNADRASIPIWGLIHDQGLAKAVGRIEDFIAALTNLPAWAAGLPIKAEGKIVPYYTKA